MFNVLSLGFIRLFMETWSGAKACWFLKREKEGGLGMHVCKRGLDLWGNNNSDVFVVHEICIRGTHA